MATEKLYWIYILECDNGSYYTGYTDDLHKRYKMHIRGKGGAKYTRSFKPVRIAGCWNVESTRSTAMRIESFIKGISRDEKEKIIVNPVLLMHIFNNVSGHEVKIVPCNPEIIEKGVSSDGTDIKTE